MKNKLKRSNSPEPRAGKGLRSRIVRLTGFAFGLAVLLALFALFVIGLPPHMTRRITAKIRTTGIPLKIDSIRLSPHHGWVLKNVQIYSTCPDDLRPLLSTEKLYLTLWPVSWKNPVDGGWHIKVKAKPLDISFGQSWETLLPEPHSHRPVNDLDVSLTAARGQVAIENATLSWSGINVHLHGTASFAARPSLAGTRSVRESPNAARYAAQVTDVLNQLKFAPSPQLNLDFNYNGARPEETFLNISLTAKEIGWRERTYKHLSGTLEYRDSLWTLSSLQLNQSVKEALTLRGEFNPEDSLTQLSIENSLPASDLLNLLPKNVLSAIAQSGIKPYGQIDFSVSAGPAPCNHLAEHVEAQIHQAQLSRLGITVDPLALHIVRDRSKVDVSRVLASVNGEPLTGSFAVDLDTRSWSATVQTQCDPALVGTLTGGGLQRFIERFRFPATPLKGDLTLSQKGPGESIHAAGTLSGDQFTCAGIPVEHVETFMTLSNHVLTLSPLHITRGIQQFDGSVQVDFTRKLAFFDATNSFPPADVARALAPNTHTILEKIQINGPIHAVGKGQMDYGAWTNHAFTGTVEAENIGFGLIQTPLFKADVEGAGTQLLFSNASAQLYNGLAEGSAAFDVFPQDGSAPYRISARLAQIDLTQLLRQLSSRDFGKTRGECSATINLTADAKASFWRSVNGGGQAKIEKGYLADIPLFGGFSRLIQTAIPGFNFFSLTSFSADYNLHHGAVWSDNAKIGGALFSATGRGNYSPQGGFNFTVTAEPLHQADPESKEWYDLQQLAANIVKIGTAPLFRLFEFQLTGPLNKPEWHLFNIPKKTSPTAKPALNSDPLEQAPVEPAHSSAEPPQDTPPKKK